jgi:hypothetical protein
MWLHRKLMFADEISSIQAARGVNAGYRPKQQCCIRPETPRGFLGGNRLTSLAVKLPRSYADLFHRATQNICHPKFPALAGLGRLERLSLLFQEHLAS